MVATQNSRYRRVRLTSSSAPPPLRAPRSRGFYKPRMTQREKLDSIRKYMRDNYRWGIREFLHAYVTEVEEEQLNDSVQIRIRKLTEAIFDHQEVLNMVKDRWKSSPDAGFILLDDLRQEIDTLRTNSVQFGQFKGEKSLEAFCNGVVPLIRMIVTRGRAVTVLLGLGLLSQVKTVLF